MTSILGKRKLVEIDDGDEIKPAAKRKKTDPTLHHTMLVLHPFSYKVTTSSIRLVEDIIDGLIKVPSHFVRRLKIKDAIKEFREKNDEIDIVFMCEAVTRVPTDMNCFSHIVSKSGKLIRCEEDAAPKGQVYVMARRKDGAGYAPLDKTIVSHLTKYAAVQDERDNPKEDKKKSKKSK